LRLDYIGEMFRLLPICVLFLFAYVPVVRAQYGLGTWNILSSSAKLSDKSSLYTEAQLRSLMFYSNFHYYEFKGGISRKITNDFSLLGGIGRYDTYSPGGDFKSPRLTREIRTWAQANLRNTLGRWTVEHRYRAEQRFTDRGYRNRFRYRIAVSLPINGEKPGSGVWVLNLWNEVFFTNRAPYYERNRIFGGMGYGLSELITIQLGYLYQFDYRLVDEIGRDFLQVGVYFTPDWRNTMQTTE